MLPLPWEYEMRKEGTANWGNTDAALNPEFVCLWFWNTGVIPDLRCDFVNCWWQVLPYSTLVINYLSLCRRVSVKTGCHYIYTTIACQSFSGLPYYHDEKSLFHIFTRNRDTAKSQWMFFAQRKIHTEIHMESQGTQNSQKGFEKKRRKLKNLHFLILKLTAKIQ